MGFSTPCKACDVYDKTCKTCQYHNRLRSEKRKYKRFLKETETARREAGLKKRYLEEDKQPGTQTKLKAGYIYCVKNPAWPNWVKVGSAIDLPKRLANYQTCDPARSYILEAYKIVGDRIEAEKEIHKRLSCFPSNGEWFETNLSTILNEFASIK